jgi:hypothetical protein
MGGAVQSASPSPILRAARCPEFIASRLDGNERLARNRFTVPPTDKSAGSAAASALERVWLSYRCTFSPKTAITDLMSALPPKADIGGQ